MTLRGNQWLNPPRHLHRLFNPPLGQQSNVGKTGARTINVTVQVAPVITLTKSADLNFGDIFTGPSTGTVILRPADTRGATGGLLLGNLSAVGAAVFTVNGAANAIYATGTMLV